jgi:hypothetical protein
MNCINITAPLVNFNNIQTINNVTMAILDIIRRPVFYLKLAVPGHALLWPFPVTD